MNRLDWLENQLENENLSAATRKKYEDEADKIANATTVIQQKRVAIAQQQAVQNAVIKAQILAGNLNVIDAFGIPEFGDDYEIALEGSTHVVYSKVASEMQNNRHTFNTFDEANSKMRKLVWDRLYSKYVRQGEVNHLSEL
jgi:hypothetical protein